MSFPSRQRAASSQSEGLLRACEEAVFEHIAPRGTLGTQNTVLERVVSVWSVPRYAIEFYLSRLVHSLYIA